MAAGEGKKLVAIKTWVDDELHREIQDAAEEDERSVSDWVRVQLIGLLHCRASGISLHVDPRKRRAEEGN